MPLSVADLTLEASVVRPTVSSRRGASLLFDGRQIQWKRSHLSVTPQRTGSEEPRRAGAFTENGEDLVPKNKKNKKINR